MDKWTIGFENHLKSACIYDESTNTWNSVDADGTTRSFHSLEDVEDGEEVAAFVQEQGKVEDYNGF